MPEKGAGGGIVFLDFDGVIAPASVEKSVSFVSGFITAIRPVDGAFLENFIASTVAFPPDSTVSYLFEGLGIKEHIPAFMKAFRSFDSDPSNGIQVDPGYYSFVKMCEDKGVVYRILSLASPERLSRIRGLRKSTVLALQGSKADPSFFLRAARAAGAVERRSLLLDDNPLSLNAASLAGIRPVWMNPAPGAVGCGGRGEFADYRVKDWREFSLLVSTLKERNFF